MRKQTKRPGSVGAVVPVGWWEGGGCLGYIKPKFSTFYNSCRASSLTDTAAAIDSDLLKPPGIFNFQKYNYSKFTVLAFLSLSHYNVVDYHQNQKTDYFVESRNGLFIRTHLPQF